MLLQPAIQELLLSVDLRHWKMDVFQTRFFNGKFDLYMNAARIEVKKFDEKREWGTVLNLDVKVPSLTVEKWKLILALVGIDPGPIEFENFESKLKAAI